MFGFIADILTSITSVLFPIFASYKALRTSDPANLAPWLMYWTTLSLVFVIENQFYFILGWIPFYSWLRLFLHLYLVLPGQQGSVYIYKEYIHPFLEEHERQIDHTISDAHAKAKAAGLDIVKQGIEYIRVQILGQQPRRPSPPPSRNVSYSTYLMGRFSMPSARDGLATAGTSDLFALLGRAMNQTTYPDSRTREAQAEDLTRSGTLIPPSLSGEERIDFVNTQRDRLRTLLSAFDAEADREPEDEGVEDLRSSRTSTMPRHRSRQQVWREEGRSHESHRAESEYDDLAYESTTLMPDPDQFLPTKKGGARSGAGAGAGAGASSSWSNWVWGNYGERDSAIDPRKDD